MVHGQILTLDNLILKGRILVNRCCMCQRNEEIVDHLLLHCPIAHSLWVYMFQIFGTQWAMSGSVESLVYCWSFWLKKFSSDIWNIVLGCLMWIVWTESIGSLLRIPRNPWFNYKLCAKRLHLIGLGVGTSQIVPLSWSLFRLLVLLFKFFFLLFGAVCLFVAFLCVHHHEHLVFAFFYFSV